jgi:hypothetical protein
MYFIDVINRNNQAERVYLDRDAFVSETEFSWEDKNEILLDYIKELKERNKERGINTNKPFKGKNKVVTTMSASTYKNGKRVPIFKQKEASDLTIFSDGTYDYNKVRSQDYNDKYFNFKELKELL